MITVEQVDQLNNKVRKAVGLIEDLKEENRRLRIDQEQLQAKIDQMQAFIDESQRNASTLSDTNDALSKGVMGAISQLSILDTDNSESKIAIEQTTNEISNEMSQNIPEEEYVLNSDAEENDKNANALFNSHKEEDSEQELNSKHMDIF